MYLHARRFKVEDQFHIFSEFKLIGISTMIATVAVTSIQLTMYLHLRDIESASVPTTALYYIADQLVYWWVIWICYAMSYRVASKLRNDPVLMAQYGRGAYGYSVHSVSPGTPGGRTPGGRTPTHSTVASTSWTNTATATRTATGSGTRTIESRIRRIKVDEMLQDCHMVEAFMAHLSHEFSVELLLSLIEFKQFKEYAERERDSLYPVISTVPTPDTPEDNEYQMMNTTKIKGMGRIKVQMNGMAPNIPLSSIVYDAEDSLREKARKLVEKYVVFGSEYEINIAGPLRNRLMEKYRRPIRRSRVFSMTSEDRRATQVNLNTIATEFDECIAEMNKLLGFSLNRFTKTMAFERLQKR